MLALRERGWEGLPPPPVFTAEKPKPADEGQKDPAATPLATSLGLPNGDLEITPHSPSTSIANLSDFTIADASDDESVGLAFADTSDDEGLIDPTGAVLHNTFYLEDGNVEVLCGGTLFRVHTSILSFHSPALRRIFGRTSLAMAESPNGCPRVLPSDTAEDFTTLLKIIYLPEFVALAIYRWLFR